MFEQTKRKKEKNKGSVESGHEPRGRSEFGIQQRTTMSHLVSERRVDKKPVFVRVGRTRGRDTCMCLEPDCCMAMCIYPAAACFKCYLCGIDESYLIEHLCPPNSPMFVFVSSSCMYKKLGVDFLLPCLGYVRTASKLKVILHHVFFCLSTNKQTYKQQDKFILSFVFPLFHLNFKCLYSRVLLESCSN